MSKRCWSVFGVKRYSVFETGKILGKELGLVPTRFSVDYTEDSGFTLSETCALHISVTKNYAHEPEGRRHASWYEEKFKEYPVIVFVAAESDKLEWPPAKWQAVDKVFDSLGWIDYLYMKEN